jgi:MGT family glycosyltransferase
MRRLKGFVFSLPAIGLNEIITLFSINLAKDYEIIFYNNESFSKRSVEAFKFKCYPEYENNYKPNCVQVNSTYIDFANTLLDTSINLIEFLKAEIEQQQPDFIIHSHLALWGKLLSLHFKIPAICIFTTFVFDKKFLLPCYENMYGRKNDAKNIAGQLSFTRKTKTLLSKLNIEQNLDIWDIAANREDLNLVFIHQELQPMAQFLDDSFKFVGYPINKIENTESEDFIYVACGSVFKMEGGFYDVCINCFIENKIKSTIVIGNYIQSHRYSLLPPYIQLLEFADQKSILRKAQIFISHGGMASIHEAVQTLTPLIIVPLIPEQQLTAEKLEELGIAKLIPYNNFSIETLAVAIKEIKSHYRFYKLNIERFQGKLSSQSTMQESKRAFNKHIEMVCKAIVSE